MKLGLLPSFIRYMESTRHLVLYRLDSTHPIPITFFMPKVLSLTLIDCEPYMISSILHRSYFPHLQQIQYLSLPPSDPFIYRRFERIGFMGWVFPILSQPYPFYDCMIEAGWGRKEQGLVSQYMVSQQPYPSIKSNKPNFDLYLPQRGIVTGKFYRDQQLRFFQKKQCDELQLPYPILKSETPLLETIPPQQSTHAIYNLRWIYDQTCLNRAFEIHVLNLPDATPCHNSNK